MAGSGVRPPVTVLFLFSFVLSCAGRSHNVTRPNIVIMLMDDMGWGDLGINGEPSRETPNIDLLAREGTSATAMYTAAPLCSPSRASLLTGRLPIRNGFYSDNAPGRNAYTPQDIVGGISKEEVLLPELLATQGYTSGLVGKWHLGHRSPHLPLERGFDFWFGSPNCHFGPYNDKTTPNIPVFKDAKMAGRYYEQFGINRTTGESNMTKLYTQEAVKFIEREAGKGPFFLYWAPDATHAPTYASKDFLGTSRRGRYGDAVRELDAGVGEIVGALKKAGVAENTLVVFSSDNGAALVSKREGGSNGPFLCGKQTTFEGGMRTPGIFWWPGVIPAGTVSHQVWTQMDLFSTAAELAGATLPEDRKMDGLPLARALQHPELEIARPVFFYRGDRLMAIRLGGYKLHLWTWSTPTNELQKGINYCPGAEVANLTTPTPTDHSARPILFNIEADPSERYPVPPHSEEYSHQVPRLLFAIIDHRRDLKKGEPQLNWCDPAVMHWAPPGCDALKTCLPVPPSNPQKCSWPH
ncbi:N-acetylgalactosamine-6-sulfatase-like [Penaeus japonicus]|uniref:N-acetylgalactosamine-6-sulfatase-like n=1 Tax=Penaeus japonicus TaxID=27405 RepID=UPI001C70ECF4|nr:N-acetylgalactosamine-6-sulfatase-like [Penaeus japonicus]